MERTGRIPESARGAVATSSFWQTHHGAEGERWRRGWWDAFDGRPARHGADEAYSLGRLEYLNHFAPKGAGRPSMILTDRPQSELREHPMNHHVKEDCAGAIAQMAASIKQYGLLQPLCVKPDGTILSGHIRFWGLQLLDERMPVPCNVLDGEDEATALEILLVSNDHITPPDLLKESDAVAKLLAQPGWNVAKVAEALGRKERWVARRAQLRNLAPELQEKIRAGKLWAGWPVDWLERVAVLARSAQVTFSKEWIGKRDWEQPEISSLKDLEAMLADELHVLGVAPFDIYDDELVPRAGPCVAKSDARDAPSGCPKTTISRPELFDNAVAGDVKTARCCDAPCWALKVVAHVRASAAAAKEASGGKLVVVRDVDVYSGPVDEAAKSLGAMASHEVTECKGTAAGAKPALKLMASGETKAIFVQTGAARTGTNDRGQPRQPKVAAEDKSDAQRLKDSKAGIASRRAMDVVEQVRRHLDDKKLVSPGLPVVRQLLVVYSLPDGSTNLDDATATAKDDGKLARNLWGRLREVVTDHLTRARTYSKKDAEKRAVWLAPLFGLSVKDLAESAIESIPDPKWWPASPSKEGSKKPKVTKKPTGGDWKGLTDAERLARVNAIRKGKGLPAKPEGSIDAPAAPARKPKKSEHRKELKDLGVTPESGVCQKCGRSEANACEGEFGDGCAWVDGAAQTKCSACFTLDGELRTGSYVAPVAKKARTAKKAAK